MKRLLVIAAMLVVATTAFADRGIEGSTVALVAPGVPLTGPGTYTFTFYVWNGSVDGTSIEGLTCQYPSGYTTFGETGGYEPGPLWLNSAGGWEISSITGWSFWAYGELLPGEDCYFFMDIDYDGTRLPDRGILQWNLASNGHITLSGTIDLNPPSPIDDRTWSAIKALYK